jgi:hypothetical protein
MPLSFQSSYNSQTSTHQIRWIGKQRRRAVGLPFNALPNPGQIIVTDPPSGGGGDINLRYEVMETATGITGGLYRFTTTLPTAQSWFILRNKTLHFPTVNSGGYMIFTPNLAAWEVIELVFLKS